MSAPRRDLPFRHQFPSLPNPCSLAGDRTRRGGYRDSCDTLLETHVEDRVEHGVEVTVVRVAGDVDLRSAPRFAAALADAVARSNRLVVVDLDGVRFMASVGLSTLLSVLEGVRATQRQLRLAAARRPVLVLLRVTGTDHEFEVYPTVADAIGQPLVHG